MGDAEPFKLIKRLILFLVKIFADLFKSLFERFFDASSSLSRSLKVFEAHRVSPILCFILVDRSYFIVWLVADDV